MYYVRNFVEKFNIYSCSLAIIVFCLYRNSFKKLHFIYFAKLQPYEQRMFLRMCK